MSVDPKQLETNVEVFLHGQAEVLRTKIEERFGRVGDVRVIFIPECHIFTRIEIEGTSLHAEE